MASCLDTGRFLPWGVLYPGAPWRDDPPGMILGPQALLSYSA